MPLDVQPLNLERLVTSGLHTRPIDRRGDELYDLISGAPQATEFALTRFLDALDERKLYNSARNVEIAAWKLANARDDEYGGSLENRMRFPLEVFEATRAAFPAEKPVWMRVSATDWVPGGWDIEDSVAFAKELHARGCDYICTSSGVFLDRGEDEVRHTRGQGRRQLAARAGQGTTEQVARSR